MKLTKIQIHSYRNIAEAELLPHERFNIIVGNNAQGKTNLLESVYLLGTMKPFRNARNIDLITYGAPFSLLKGSVVKDGVTREISLSISETGKKAFVDRKPVVSPSDFFGNLNMVVFSPEDISMVRGLPETRRRYLDRGIFGGDTSYLGLHQEYFRILKNRNALLKRGESDGLSVWTERLADAAARLMVKRDSFVREIGELLEILYRDIAGSGEKAAIRYRSRVTARDRSIDEIRMELRDTLSGMAGEEQRRGTTLAGPHRDDLEYVLNDRPLNHHGSQGEQRSFVLALKMAEIERLKRKWGSPPVLLLDDITSELDRDRNGNFMEFLHEKDMQVFITTTSLDNLRLGGIGFYYTFPVRGGKVFTEVANV
jgi:DNA replication and repair protein RecF